MPPPRTGAPPWNSATSSWSIIPATGGMPKGKALDLLQALPIVGSDAHIVGTTSYDETENSDVVLITAGLPRAGHEPR